MLVLVGSDTGGEEDDRRFEGTSEVMDCAVELPGNVGSTVLSDGIELT